MPDTTEPSTTRFWPALADLVVKRPVLVLLLTLGALVPAALRGADFDWNYDALVSLKPTYPARRGTEMVKKHWSIGETGPVTIVAVTDQAQSPAKWQEVASEIASNVRKIQDVENIRSLNTPLGTHLKPVENTMIRALAGKQVAAEFLSRDGQAMRLQVVLNRPPLTREAMADVAALGDAARRALEAAKISGSIHLTGQSAEMIDMRNITHQDFHRVAALAMVAILILITLALRDVLLAAFILAATVLSYLTTLGLTYWIFTLLGHHGLEWKVQMLLFMVLVAVGQDYSIFFALRVAQEARDLPCVPATRRALVFTGPVISSCGLIMAATLGSVMAGDVQALVEMGVAFALGMLIDTFIVRPLLLPAFIVLTGRTLKKAGKIAG